MTVWLLLLGLSGQVYAQEETCPQPPCTTVVELTTVEDSYTSDSDSDDLFELMADDPLRSPYWYEPATDWLFFVARWAVGEAHVAEAALLGLGAALHHSMRLVWVSVLAPVAVYVRRRLGWHRQSEEPSLTPSTRLLVSKAVERQMAACIAEQHKQTNLLRTQLHTAERALAQRDKELIARIESIRALRETLEAVLSRACNAAGHPLDEPQL